MRFSFCSSLRRWRSVSLHALLMAFAGAALSYSATEAIRQALQNGQLDQAARLVQQEKQANPKDVQIRFLEGVVQAQQGQTERAIDSFRRLIESNPELIEAHNNLGVLYAAKGRLDEARKALEAGMLANASYATLHRNLDDVQSQLTKQTYAKALQVDPKVRGSAPQLSLLGSMEPRQAAASASRNSITVVAIAPPLPPALPPPPISPASVAASAVSVAARQITPAAIAASAPAPTPAPPPAPVAKATPEKAAPPPPASAVEAVQAPEAEAVRSAVLAWAKAWSQKDMDSYLGAYAESFVPSERMSRAKWEIERRQRIVSKKKISVEVRQLKITSDGKSMTAQFQQIYASDNFSGNSRKSLELIKQGGRWLIARETVN